MKAKTIFKYTFGLLLLIMGAIAIEPSVMNFLPDWLGAIFNGDPLAILSTVAPTAAGQAIAETVTVTEGKAASDTLYRPKISNIITKIRPDLFPMDTIMREVGMVGDCPSETYKFYSSNVRGVTDTMTVEHTQSDVKSAVITITNSHIWLADDIGVCPEITVDSEEFRFKVMAVDTTNLTITILAINGTASGGSGTGAFVPALANATKITRIGNAKGELDAQNTPYANFLTDTENYVQVFMCQVEESLTNAIHLKEVEWNINDFKQDAILDMRRMAELTMLFGYPKLDLLDTLAQKKVNLMGGARHFITGEITYGHSAAGTNATFNSWANTIFSGNNGSDRRYLFGGNNFMEWLMNIPFIEKRMAANESEVIAGIKFRVIDTIFGELYIRRHQGFSDVEGFSYNALVLDMNNVERRFQSATETKKLNLDETGVRRVKAFRIREAWTMAFRNEETHRWITDTD